MITETSSAEAGGSKPDWIKNLVACLNAQPDVTAFLSGLGGNDVLDGGAGTT